MVLNNAINAVYQENQTWTPTISGSTSAGVGTYTGQFGFWNRIGNIMNISGSVFWTNHTGTGNMLITNLTYSCNNTAHYDPELPINMINISLPGNTLYVLGEIQPGTTIINLNSVANNGSNTPISMSTSGMIHFTGTYLVHI